MATNVWQLHASAAVEQRRTARRSVAVTGATVARGCSETDAATLLDLSIYGCRLGVERWHDKGDRLWLRFDGGWPVAASVVWTDGARIGCRFDAPIAGSLMRELTRALF